MVSFFARPAARHQPVFAMSVRATGGSAFAMILASWRREYDWWLADAADGWADPDDDGYGNLEEFLNGSDPRKAERLP